MAEKKRRRVIVVVASVVVVIVLAAVLGPYIYIHFIEGPAPAKLELPSSSATTTTSKGSATTSSSSSLDGTWNVGSGSQAGYRVQEVLVGQNATAVGRTSKIWGSMTISGSTATLTPSAPINLGTIPADDAVEHYPAVGDLDMHGVTKSVSFPVTAERIGPGMDELADVRITFSEWN